METELVTTTLMTPDMANFAGNVHGGHVLRLVDQVAYACASQYAGKYCVTLSVDRVMFKVPVRVGDLLTMKARVNYTGRTSLQIGVRVEARDLQGGEARHTNTCFLTMVAMAEGQPTAVPRLVPKNEEDRRRWRRAELARQQAPAIERLAAHVEEYHAMVDLAAVAILLVNRETGVVRLANRQAAELLQRSGAELEGTLVWDLHIAEERQKARQHFFAAQDVHFADPVVLVHQDGAGQPLPLEVMSWVIPLPTQPLIQRIMRPCQGPGA